MRSEPRRGERRASYHRAYQKRFTNTTLPPSYSNGSLMRCAPLVLYSSLEAFRDGKRSVTERAAKHLMNKVNQVFRGESLSNPYPLNIECSQLYGLALGLALQGWPRSDIYFKVRELATVPEVKEVFQQIETGQRPTTLAGQTKGYVINAFYYSMLVLSTTSSYREIVDAIASRHGEDTDTNAAIAGALIGVLEGAQKMLTEPVTAENYRILVEVNKIDYQGMLTALGL